MRYILNMIQLCCFKASIVSLFETIAVTILAITLILAVCVPVVTLYLRFHFKKERNASSGSPASVAFFHPYCNSVSGREQVLWNAVLVISSNFPGCKIVIFSGDTDCSPRSLIHRAKSHLNVQLPENIEILYLRKRRFIESQTYPYLSVLCQGFGSLILGLEAISLHLPDIFIDTTGWSLMWPIFSFIGGCKVATYTHSPAFIAKTVSNPFRFYNSTRSKTLARSPLLAGWKILYSKTVSWLFAIAGRSADVIMVNSTWTENLVNALWDCAAKTFLVYPPCDVKSLEEISLNRVLKAIKIISVGQFRPEKDHPMQLKMMYQLRQILSEDKWNKVKLIIIGTTQSANDATHFKDMQDLCKHLSLENNVEFKINITYDEKKEEFREGLIGLHTMAEEHFGIGLVEMMAAGLVVVAHGSGGPKLDIIESNPRNGFLATSEVEFADKIAAIVNCPNEEYIQNIQRNARASVERFSVEEFSKEFLRIIQILFPVNPHS